MGFQLNARLGCRAREACACISSGTILVAATNPAVPPLPCLAVNAGKNKPGQQTVSGKPAFKLDQETEDFHRECLLTQHVLVHVHMWRIASGL